MKRALHLIIYILLAGLGTLHAQNVEQAELLQQADEDYRLGRFEAVEESLTKRLTTLNGNNRQKALRLLALCALAQDNDAACERYARQLVELNNYYTNVDDPQRFQDLVNNIKAGLTLKVTTASSVSESLEEAPVPVTIITAEMIENLGNNKNLNNILATYVPGMAEIQSMNDDNIAMHGAYAEEQELILVMENGHRLNMRTTNAFSMGYDISTEKIDHIEVLRGPASSLYGNVALSAVVNIITKSGADIDGVKLKAAYGSYKTQKMELTAGKRFMDIDVTAWASVYMTDGEHRKFQDTAVYQGKFYVEPDARFSAIVDAYRDTPSYDLGMTFKYKGFNLYFSRKSGKKTSQYGLYGYYNYGRYHTLDGQKPGVGLTATLLEASYARQIGRMNVSAAFYSDWYRHNSYLVESPEYEEDEQKTPELRFYSYGDASVKLLHEHSMGGNLKVGSDYTMGAMSGNLLLGCQFEHCKIIETSSTEIRNYKEVLDMSLYTEDKLPDHENSLSFYAQAKHLFSPKFIFNAGARYDIKYRYNEKAVTAFSPRLAFIFMPSADFSMKLGYSKAFVDMSLTNRILGNISLESSYLPQYLTALQYSMMGRIRPLHLRYEVNVFWNNYKNLFSYANGIDYEKKILNEGHYMNWGIEATAAYRYRRWAAVMNLYWCKDIKAEAYYYDEENKRVAAVPHFTANLNVGWTAIDHNRHQLKVYGNANLVGRKHYVSYDYLSEDGFVKIPHTTGTQTTIDLGVKYTYNKQLQLSVDCENVTDCTRFILGPDFDMFPQYQRGRRFMGTIAYAF